MASRKELADLENLGGTFLNRIAVCVTYFAQYVLNESPSAAYHKTRAAWALGATSNPSAYAQRILALVSVDATFVNQQSPVTDWAAVLNGLPETGAGSLQAAVENVINLIEFS